MPNVTDRTGPRRNHINIKSNDSGGSACADCTALNNGKYLMQELPENYGMYECKDVKVYPVPTGAPDTAVPDKNKKLGEYCLVEK